MAIGQEYGTLESAYEVEAALHTRGTVRRARSIDFWLTRPRPEDVSIDEWERLEQSKWERIFGKKGGI